MRLIDVKTLLALQVMARTAAGDFFALDAMRHYLLDRDPHAYMPFNFLPQWRILTSCRSRFSASMRQLCRTATGRRRRS